MTQGEPLESDVSQISRKEQRLESKFNHVGNQSIMPNNKASIKNLTRSLGELSWLAVLCVDYHTLWPGVNNTVHDSMGADNWKG